MRKLYLFLIVFLAHQIGITQMPLPLKKNVAVGQSWIYPSYTPTINGKIVYWMDDGVHGNELWVTNGTQTGTNLLKDITLGTGSTSPDNFFYQTPNGIFFEITGFDSYHKELWFTDGTESNTRLILKGDDVYLTPLDQRNAKFFNNALYIVGSINGGNNNCIYKVTDNSTYTSSSALFKSYPSGGYNMPVGSVDALEVFKNNLIASTSNYHPSTSNGGNYWSYELSTVNTADASASTFFSVLTDKIVWLQNINDNYLALKYKPDNEPFVVAKFDDVSGNTSPQILTSLISVNYNTGSEMDHNYDVTHIGNVLYFLKKANFPGMYPELWATDGTVSGTLQAPFTFTSIHFFGIEGTAALFQVDDNNSSKALFWDGSSNPAQIYSESSSTFNNNEVLESKLDLGGKTFLFTSFSLYVRNVDDAHIYKLFGSDYENGQNKIRLQPYAGNSGVSTYNGYNILNNNIIGIGNNASIPYPSGEVYLFSPTLKIWTGDNSSDWNNPANWFPTGIPTQNDDVFVPKVPSGNYPVVNQNSSCKSFFINYGSLTINASVSLNVYDQLSNYAQINGAGSVNMMNTALTKLTGNGSYNMATINLSGSDVEVREETKTMNTTINFLSDSKLFLNDYDLFVNIVSGYNSNRFIVTNGNGFLSLSAAVKGDLLYPIGADATHYNPIAVPPLTNYSIRSVFGSYQNGLSGSANTTQAIANTWVFNNYAPSTVKLFWNNVQELPCFNRNVAKLAGYDGSAWEYTTPSAATSEGGNMYSLSGTFNNSAPTIFTLVSDATLTTYYQDLDGDGFGNASISTQSCTQPSGYVLDNTDCNDNNASIHAPVTYYRDADGDGFGDINHPTTLCQTTPPQGYVTNSSDCDDTQQLYLDADGDGYGSNTLVACGGVTNHSDCDDNNAAIHSPITYYRDADGDGYGNAAITTSVCSTTTPTGYVTNNTDCNDNDATIYPGAPELCDGKDNNCNGTIDEGCSTSPVISINSVTVYESQLSAQLTVSLSKASNQTIKVSYATADGSATSTGRNKDYSNTKGNLSIPAGSLSATITIPINNDKITEPTENFTVQLSKPVNATLASPSHGTVTILDGTGTLLVNNNTNIKLQKNTSSVYSELSVKAYPNPSTSAFLLQLTSSAIQDGINLRVIDALGHVIEQRQNLMAGQNLQLGNNYQPGIYMIEVRQGKQVKTLKLVKF